MKVLAVIPARGGSKRLPGKNILPLNGKPMIAWTIQAALESGIFEDVFVYTDSEEIAKVALEYGAKVPFLRDASDSDDFTPSSVATINAVRFFEKHMSKNYDTVSQLMANCPCRNSLDIKEAYNYFRKEDHNFQVSVFKFGWMNPWWAMKMNSNNNPNPLFPEAMKSRSQDLESLFCPTGAVWFAKKNPLLDAGTFYGPDYKVFPMSWMSALDIDDHEDLEMAQAAFILKSKPLREKL